MVKTDEFELVYEVVISCIIGEAEMDGRVDIGALRVLHVMQKNATLPDDRQKLGATQGEGEDGAATVILQLDCWLWMPR